MEHHFIWREFLQLSDRERRRPLKYLTALSAALVELPSMDELSIFRRIDRRIPAILWEFLSATFVRKTTLLAKTEAFVKKIFRRTEDDVFAPKDIREKSAKTRVKRVMQVKFKYISFNRPQPV